MGRKRTREEGEWTTISIPKVVKGDLDEIGKHGENYGDILRRILKDAKRERAI